MQPNWIARAGAVFCLAALADAHTSGAGLPALAQEIIGLVKSHTSSSEQLQNYAAILPAEGAELQVVKASFPTPDEDELVIKNHAVAINPVDWKIQTLGGARFNLEYPVVLGEDVAGEVVQVGQKLKDRFHVGQRVLSYTLGLSGGNAYGGFQLYPLLKGSVVATIPDYLSYEEAVVLPLSISTAAAGLFLNATLALDYPTTKSRHSQLVDDKYQTLLVWGGSSSVGSSVIRESDPIFYYA